MLKNSVFKPSVSTQKWAKAAGIRSIKTMAQTAVAVIGTGAVISAVDWKMVVSSAIVAGIFGRNSRSRGGVIFMANRKIGQAGFNLIKQYEGCRLSAYQCAAGVWTIGYGHTAGVKKGMTITQAQADAY